MSNFLPEPIQKVIQEFSRLPGIGQKTAQRLAFFLIRSSEGIEKSLGKALIEMKDNLTYCKICQNISLESPCKICDHPARDHSTICLVEEPLDVIAIEKTGQYNGLYHVLHGVISPIDGIGPETLKIREFFERLENNSAKEIILALNPSLEGEATSMYIQKMLSENFPSLDLTQIARGLPMGGDLEYADDKTLIRAIVGRRKY